ncbi:MAG TPA: hypothetical protein VKZ59_09290 [Acidobacteriota bacterium]|nr:hypothetical protein [Acidobacteriota bacterium]
MMEKRQINNLTATGLGSECSSIQQNNILINSGIIGIIPSIG